MVWVGYTLPRRSLSMKQQKLQSALELYLGSSTKWPGTLSRKQQKVHVMTASFL